MSSPRAAPGAAESSGTYAGGPRIAAPMPSGMDPFEIREVLGRFGMGLAGGEHSQAPGVPVNIGISTPEPNTVGAPVSASPSPGQSRTPTPTRKRSPERGAKQDPWAQARGPDNAAIVTQMAATMVALQQIMGGLARQFADVTN